VIDDRLKDEIKITVIATGFEPAPHKSSSAIDISKDSSPYAPSSFLKSKAEEKNEERMSQGSKKSRVSPLKAAQAEPAKNKERSEEEEDDELGIPAFIRKKMM